mmetsp:Transcript_62663/g.177163  ORF Transcript_62663/g.177163 Transcript_62663/m.177163 type:complete len:134 (-) Transcript_62663:153-554(-)|eukprot:CAMPEP_0177468736 /NCGR_PEP_ID=MMETSP0369-20130122/19244_1 /TAXON_ID=447022 ORGANISM="Scrippsiella hangoei-like, Strain SHHI-4" /NCGR_SAMPLE_ID=MMETSP0369 /ASSEMBLY_ACC=CAM_ASM_000364 /LENGTH=133 /DNA_ID=CAMNT_0018942983 /DNA_START=8 /DNA_END=409 /DNA_ORIENTATION=-
MCLNTAGPQTNRTYPNMPDWAVVAARRQDADARLNMSAAPHAPAQQSNYGSVSSKICGTTLVGTVDCETNENLAKAGAAHDLTAVLTDCQSRHDNRRKKTALKQRHWNFTTRAALGKTQDLGKPPGSGEARRT